MKDKEIFEAWQSLYYVVVFGGVTIGIVILLLLDHFVLSVNFWHIALGVCLPVSIGGSLVLQKIARNEQKSSDKNC